MIEIKIPQEINKYESKLVGPLTTRLFSIIEIMFCDLNILLDEEIIVLNNTAKINFSALIPYGLYHPITPKGIAIKKQVSYKKDIFR